MTMLEKFELNKEEPTIRQRQRRNQGAAKATDRKFSEKQITTRRITQIYTML